MIQCCPAHFSARALYRPPRDTRSKYFVNNVFAISRLITKYCAKIWSYTVSWNSSTTQHLLPLMSLCHTQLLEPSPDPQSLADRMPSKHHCLASWTFFRPVKETNTPWTLQAICCSSIVITQAYHFSITCTVNMILHIALHLWCAFCSGVRTCMGNMYIC